MRRSPLKQRKPRDPERERRRANRRGFLAAMAQLQAPAPPDPPSIVTRARTAPEVAPEPRVVSTERTARPVEKRGDWASPAYLAWVRAQTCSFCGGPGGDPHHVPTRGSLGGRADLLVASACRACHDRCGVAEAHGGYPKLVQAAAVHATLLRFWQRAPAEVKRRVLDELAHASDLADAAEVVTHR